MKHYKLLQSINSIKYKKGKKVTPYTLFSMQIEAKDNEGSDESTHYIPKPICYAVFHTDNDFLPQKMNYAQIEPSRSN